MSVARNVRMARDLGLLHVPDASLVDIEAVDSLPPRPRLCDLHRVAGRADVGVALMAAGDNKWRRSRATTP